MDQLKDVLAGVMKYGFWIGCGLILVASLGMWYVGTSDLIEQSARQTNKIEQSVTQVSTVKSGLAEQPNETSHTQMRAINEARQQDILNSWGELFKRQQDILVWPVDELKRDFVKEFEGKIPIENYIEYPTNEKDEIESALRTRYERYINKVLPAIASIGGTHWKVKSVGNEQERAIMAQMKSAEENPELDPLLVDEPLVAWDSGNQTALLADLFPWQGQVPSTLQIYYSQENLWILRQLMDVIAAVNQGATRPYQAKIHQINDIAIGSSVEVGVGQIDDPRVDDGTLGFGDVSGGDFSGFDDDAAVLDGSEEVDPAERRYLNVTGTPITGAELRSALTSAQPSDVALAIAKRVPVMMSLNMHQKAVPELIAACGSAKLLIQVNQIRILPKSGSLAQTSSPINGGRLGSRTEVVREEYPFDMNVQIFGVIFIYNPPKREQLGLEAITEATVDEVVAKATGDVDAVREAESKKQTAPESTNDVLPNPGAVPPGTSPDAASPDPAAPADTPETTVPPTDPAVVSPPAIIVP